MTDVAPAPSQIAVRAPDGSVGHVGAADVDQALRAGAELVSPEELQHEQLQAEYGGMGGQVASFGMGAASGLTFGGSDALIAGMGGQEALKNYSEANPNARTAGEVGGIGASLLIPVAGEAGLAARGVRAATAAPRLVAGAGRLAERGVAGLLEREGAGLLERAAVKGLSGAAGGAVEGAAYGAAHEISDASINDHELTAEKLLAAAKHGALWGGGAGAALGTGGEVMGSAFLGLGNAVSKKVGEGSSLAEVLDRKSGEIAFRSAGGGKAVSKAADKFGEGYAQVGKIWRDDAPSLVGKRSFADMTREDLREAAGVGMKREGASLGDDLARMTKHAEAAGTLPSAMSVVSDIEQVAAQVAKRAGTEPAVAKLEAFAASVKRITGLTDDAGTLLPNAGMKQLTYEELRNFRVDADNMWRGASKDPSLTGATKFFGDVRDGLEKRVLNGAEQAGVKSSYEAAKNKYQAFSLLNRATEGGVAAEGSNRFFSLTDNLATHAGAVAGGVVGGPLGTALGASVGGMLSRTVRTRGDFLAADLLHRIGRMGTIENMATSVDNRIAEGVKGFLQGIKSEARAESTKVRPHHETLLQSQQIADGAKNPGLVQARLQNFVGNLGDVAPNVTAAIATKVAGSYGYLGDKMPKMRGDPNSLTPQFVKVRAPESEIQRAGKYMQGVQDPLSALDEMMEGRLSREMVQALRATSPRLFEQIQTAFVEELPNIQKQLSFEQECQVSTLLGVPANQFMVPDFIATMQKSKEGDAPPPEQAPQQQKGGGRRPIKLDSASMDPNPTRT